ncbi:ABC transporter ATP binding protein [Methanocella paludicola SANAE]|uniref:ABC transporter ATP binding protein n=1 Tax=Methanocella paludicola (strain DSM 17711 / JCM 13418 / NBRC 101707 / SANAE) TaxID=304371 RepID=D1YXZ0_METPS|nr:ABC transporter ATP-binding protein [Methanocella paludicola]BAI61312.1 ABC transporter ATP binding protein [Methanocella paludicola SANAE]
METVIQTTDLTKFYGKSRGIKDVSITVNKGDIFGFLGPNGAGKSTTIRTLLDFIRPSAGSATIFGMDCRKDSVAIRKRIGYIPGDFGLYGHMTGWKFLEYFGRIRGGYDTSAAKEYSKKLDIRLDRRMKEYSRGMRQKVAIIQAFMNNPDLIIMDEPTNGLDPLVQQTFMDMLHEDAGRTIFMSSHVLSEVEKSCNRVAIIKEGRIVTEEQVEALRQKSGKVLEVKFAQPLTKEIFYLPGISNLTQVNGAYRMTVTGSLEELLQEISRHRLADISIHQMTLEDIFMHYYEGAK